MAVLETKLYTDETLYYQPMLIVAIIIYDRYSNLERWLKCWQQCDQHNAPLYVIHTGDEIEKFKSLCDQYGVNYIHRNNQGLDIGAVQDVFRERLEGFPNDWEYLLWITDDVLPMRKDFVQPFLEHMQPGVGITALQISQAVATHVRTVCYCIRKEVSRKINFPADPVVNKIQGYYWEHRGGSQTLTRQVTRMGYRCVQVAAIENAPLWDTGYGKRLERLNEFYAMFPQEPKPVIIHHFYHIFADGKWQEPVHEHIRALKMGLLDNLTSFHIGIVGSRRNRLAVKLWLAEQGLLYVICNESDTGWEQVTQIPLHSFALNNEGYVFYAHSKGAANVSDTNTKWRRSMTYYNVLRWQTAVEKLNEGYDAAGQHWMFPSHHSPEHKGWPFFGGTFWWTSLKHIRTLGEPSLEHRHIAEGWIGEQYYNKEMKCFDFTGHISAHPCHSLWKHDWV